MVVKLDPENRDAWLDYAETLFKSSRMEEALEAYGSALSLKPDCAGAYVQQAKALLALGRSEESLRSLKMAFVIDPKKKDEWQTSWPELLADSRIRRELGLDG